MNTLRLRDAVEYLRNNAMPSNPDGSALCTVQDVRKVVDTLATVLMTFVEELEGPEEG